MFTEYVVEHGAYAGTVLHIGLVPREQIDRFVAENARPEPPRVLATDKGIEVWGDPEATVDDHEDKEYQRALREWWVAFGRGEIELIAPAVTVADEGTQAKAAEELEEQRALSLHEDGGVAALLANIVLQSDEDLSNVVEAVMYNSTVTMRGIVEAARMYGVKLDGAPLSPFIRSKKAARLTSHQIYNDRLCARWGGYKWPDFCALTGPEQSAVVALRRLSVKAELVAARS